VSTKADSVVVFNEIMYHPATNEPALEWVELHNQMAVDVDLSGWSLAGGIDFKFAEGAVIQGGGYLVVALSPADLEAATGLTNALGPFSGRLSNSGEKLELYNNNGRLMDSVNYDVEGDWPVAPDGSGVSLAKADEDTDSGSAANWRVSAFVGGTPGRRNFPLEPFETTTSTPILLEDSWKYDASGNDPGAGWREESFDDSGWSSGNALFQAGDVTLPFGDPEPLPTVFSTGVGENGAVLAPGTADPHYQLTLSPQSTPPPPPIAATVLQNHPAWLANDSLSSWIGPVNPGTTDVAAGGYNYRTTFSLDGFDPATTRLTMSIGVDDQLSDVLLNGVSRGIAYSGFTSMSGNVILTNGFISGDNPLDFLAVNAGTSANPAGFRLKVSGVANRQITPQTTLASGPITYCFRKKFTVSAQPQLASVRLNAVVADGAVFYLNGVEVLRLNMPAGTVSPSTLAVSNVPAPAYLGPFELANVRSGTNVLAVELHQGPDGDNDVLFGAELSLTVTNVLVPPPLPLAFNELSPATNNSSWLELINYGSTPVNLGGCVVDWRGATHTSYLFPPHTLEPGELMQLPEATLGFRPEPDDRLFLYAAGNSRVLDGVVVKAEPRARYPDGTGRWCAPAALTPAASNVFAFHDEIVINEIMYHPPALPAEPGTIVSNSLVSITNTWKYQALGQDLGASWRAMAFDDVSWPVGAGLFYNTTSVLPAPKNTELPLTAPDDTPIITYYFRTQFLFPAETNRSDLVLHPLVDDGAVYYLNGSEIFRERMPAGEIRYTDFASVGVATPAYSGPYIVTVTNLIPAGTNLLAVEVHQFTTNPIAADMAFGLEVGTTGDQMPSLPARDSPESWIELFNRSMHSVDLTGWRIDGGIDFRFAAGTTVPTGGYLVLAKDVGYMQSNYPAITVAGPFTNKLSHKTDHLMLKDPANNIADEVTYFDRGRWHEYADGGGSSLELRDPSADNSTPEAWAASDESGRSGWSNYTYRAVAVNVLGPTRWNEFILGLLDAGECLIDDLHVIESPDSAPVEMLQNGSFETGLTAWRVLGDHSHSRVETDPEDPGNHVLHLVATGPTDHMHNHLETTYANSRSVVNGRQYQVSFRAKWLAGNNRLNTRLYFNRVARTTALPMPLQHGTPGASNSVFASNIGPTFANFRHSPVVPQAGELVTVSVDVGDPDGVSEVTLRWSTNSSSWLSSSMAPTSGPASPGYASSSATLPGLAAGTLVQSYVEAADNPGSTSSFPAAGTNSRALFKVDDGAAFMPQLHRIRLLMTPADAELLHAPTNVMSNDRLGVTVIYDEREVFYDVGVHLQRSERGRNDPSSAGFTVKLDPTHLFRGVQDSFTIDRSGGQSGLGGRHDEILLWHAVNHAGGIPGLDCDLVQLFAPRAQQNSTGLMRMAAFDDNYFDNQFRNGGDGATYKMELIYYPTTTTTGDPQAPKLPQPDEVINVDFQDWGDDQENYRWIFIQENQADRDDYGQIIALNKAFSLSWPGAATQMNRLMDVDEWLRTVAFKAFTGDVDTYMAGLNHNWKVYFRPDDGKALGLLWDMDYSFVQALDTPFPGTGSATTYKLITYPDNYRRYYNHLLDLMTTTINSAHLGPWAAHYSGLLGQNWSGVVNYLQQRADYIRSKMPLTTSFAITSNGGNDFSTTNSHVTLTGTAPLTVYTIEVNGVAFPITWTSLTEWNLTVPLSSYINVLVCQGRDNYGALLTSAVDSITVTNLGAPAPRPVVINEWMAANTGPAGFADLLDGRFQDWFELYNPNDITMDLSGFYLTDTLSTPTKWQIPTNTVIQPHGFLLVWADDETSQNGLGTNGALHANFQLSLSGEAIGLFSPEGVRQHAVTFGPQTQNVSQGFYPDGDTNTMYFMTDWTPGASNRLGAPPQPQMGTFSLDSAGTFSFQSSAIPGRTYRVEYRDDLNAASWLQLGDIRTASGPSLTIEDNTMGRARRFYRIVLLQ